MSVFSVISNTVATGFILFYMLHYLEDVSDYRINGRFDWNWDRALDSIMVVLIMWAAIRGVWA